MSGGVAMPTGCAWAFYPIPLVKVRANTRLLRAERILENVQYAARRPKRADVRLLVLEPTSSRAVFSWTFDTLLIYQVQPGMR
jgi:hypothetical protein